MSKTDSEPKTRLSFALDTMTRKILEEVADNHSISRAAAMRNLVAGGYRAYKKTGKLDARTKQR